MKLFVVLSRCSEFAFDFVSAFQSGVVAPIGALFAADTAPQAEMQADASGLDADAAEAIANLTQWIKPVEMLGRRVPVASAATA